MVTSVGTQSAFEKWEKPGSKKRNGKALESSPFSASDGSTRRPTCPPVGGVSRPRLSALQPVSWGGRGAAGGSDGVRSPGTQEAGGQGKGQHGTETTASAKGPTDQPTRARVLPKKPDTQAKRSAILDRGHPSKFDTNNFSVISLGPQNVFTQSALGYSENADC